MCVCTVVLDEDISIYTGTLNHISPVPCTRTVKSLDSGHIRLLLPRPLTSNIYLFIYLFEEEMLLKTSLMY